MGTSDELVLHCTELIAAQGIATFSLRKLAERVGIKAPSIYAHFESKEALLAAARLHARAALREALAAGPQEHTPRQRLLASAMAYLQFAQDRPHLFALLMMETPSSRTTLDEAPDPESPYALLLARVRDFLGETHPKAETLCFGLWSLVHGAAMLRQTHLQAFSASVPGLTRENIESLLDSRSPA